MELPSFDLLWTASEKLVQFETALDQLDHNKMMKSIGEDQKRRRKRYGGLYGVKFESENRDYYIPVKSCCDDSFYTQHEYQRHLDLHIKCPFEECSFVSHPKLMRVHKEVVHDGGLFQHIYRSSSDKGVQNWREARRRNYPTLERVQAKQDLILERMQRGDIFETKQFGTMHKGHSSLIKVPASSPIATDQTTHPTPEVTESVVENQTIEDSNQPSPDRKIHCSPPPSPDQSSSSPELRLVAEDYDSDDSQENEDAASAAAHDDGDQDQNQDCKHNHGRNDHEEDDAQHPHDPVPKPEELLFPIEEDSSKPKPIGSSRNQRRRAKRRSKHQPDLADPEDSGSGGEPTPKTKPDHQDSLMKPSSSRQDPFASHPIVQLQAKRRRCLANINQIHSRPTLLQMLLAEDIRKERNQLMQCIRYIVKCNFFMDDDKKSQ